MKSTRLSLKQLLEMPVANAIWGSEDDADAGGAGTGEDKDDKSKDDKSKGTKSDDGGKGDKGSSGDNPDAKIAALEEEKDRHFRLRQEAESELDELRKWKKDKEAEGQTEVEKRDTRIKELEADNTTLQTTLRSLAIENAFLSVNDVEWHNPSRALSLADLSDVEVDKNGKADAKAVKAAIEKLAKAEPYLVKPKSGDDTDEDKSKKTTTGVPPARRQGKANTDRAALDAKYPALRTRSRS